MRFAICSVATTNSQFSLKISTTSAIPRPACCSERTASILDARVLASSHADDRTSVRSIGAGVTGLVDARGVEDAAVAEIDNCGMSLVQ